MVAPIPNKNAGPALTQKDSIRSLSALDRLPLWKACAMLCAPTGYPPITPVKNIISAPSGIRNNLARKLNAEKDMLPIDWTNKIENKKKGNNEGITVRMHSVIPSVAPCRAVLVSKINTIMQREDKVAVMSGSRFLTVITSKDSMHPYERTSPSGIYFS